MNEIRRSPNDETIRRFRVSLRALVRRFSLAERADVACCGMTVAQWATLEALTGEDGLRLGELSRRLGISASTLTRNLGRLEERGLVVRLTDSSDRRAARVALTRAGREAAAAAAEQEDAFVRDLLARLPGGGAEEVVGVLERLLGAVREATQVCCPGAFDHLMDGDEWSPRKGCCDGTEDD